MLDINNVTKIYSKGGQKFTALENVSIKVEQGEFVAVTGPSGSGKSTLLHTIGGLIHPNSGQVLYKGRDVYKMSNQEVNMYRKRDVGFVFQQFHLMPYLTVFENIQIAEIESESKNVKIEELLEKCALLKLRNKYPAELSVGEKQRTAFIRAIISKPEILLADEPTGNLDPENSKILMSLIHDFHQNGHTVLLVSHDEEIASFASRIIRLNKGKQV